MKTVYIQKSCYASLCWYGARQLGFLGNRPMPEHEDESKCLSPLNDAFVTKPPTTTGRHLPFIYHLPSALDPQTPQELREVTNLICSGIKGHSLDKLAASWPGAEFLWTYDGTLRSQFAGEEDQTCDLIRKFSEFLLSLWQGYLPVYEEKQKDYPFGEYEKRCQEMNVIQKWEDEYQEPYPYNAFFLVICPESPTKAMSIKRDRIVFGAEHSWDMLRQAVIHEVGVRVPGLDKLWEPPVTRPIATQDAEGLITLVEAETCYRKPRVFPDIGEDDFLSGMELEDLVALRESLGETDSIHDTYAQWYLDAKSEGLLPLSLEPNPVG